MSIPSFHGTAVRFQCPVCQAALVTSDDNVDQRVQCTECTSELIVPFDEGDDEKLIAEEASGFGADNDLIETEMDMTPMVDVTFLLLIFFMVTASFTLQKSFQVPTPEDDRPSENVEVKEKEEGVITVRIDEYNTFYVAATNWDEERESPSEQELRRNLREAKEGDGDMIYNTLIVEAHVDAHHDKVVMVMDLGTDFGLEQVRLKTIEEDS